MGHFEKATLFLFYATGASLGGIGGTAADPAERLDVRHVRLELPGAPASLLPADLDGDGLQDLVVVLAYTEIDSVTEERIEEMASITTVIPAVFDRREARAYLARPDGTYVLAGSPIPLPPSVLSIVSGPDPHALLAMTDAGIAVVRLDPTEPPRLVLEHRIDDPPVIAGTENFVTWLEWVHDLNGDGRGDVVWPSRTGLAIYLAQADGSLSQSAPTFKLPGDRNGKGPFGWRSYPLPRVRDLDGDGDLDILVLGSHADGAAGAGPSHDTMHVFTGNGDGTFTPLHAGADDCRLADSAVRVTSADGSTSAQLANLAFFGDIDGDGRAEAVTREEIEPEKDGLRAGMKQAKRPRQKFRVYRLDERLGIPAAPAIEFEAIGHDLSVTDLGLSSGGQFRDLDGDGRLDLITVTLDFSMFQALRVLTTKRLSIGLDFHVWRQERDGTFGKVPGLDLSEKLKIKLSDFSLGRIAHFAGDFNADGRTDFVHLGRGKKVTVHRGEAGCRYPAEPDLVIELEEEPQDVMLARIRDLDGDGRSDLCLTRLLPAPRVDVSPEVVLDLYLSGRP